MNAGRPISVSAADRERGRLVYALAPDRECIEIDTDRAAFAGLSFGSKLPSLAEIDAGQFRPRISRVQPDG